MRRTELTVRQREEERERERERGGPPFLYIGAWMLQKSHVSCPSPSLPLNTEGEKQRVRGRTPKEEEQTKQKGLVLWVTLLRGNDIVVGKVILPLLCSQKSIFSKGTGA